jgi:hypothetical protein
MAANRTRRKERHRLKRKEKQEELRKERDRQRLQAFGDTDQSLRSYINHNWRRQGMASILSLKPLKSGGHAMAAFLIDLTCCGLKDCWGKLEVSPGEFDSLARNMPEAPEITMVPADTALVRRLVAGAIRFTTENRLRLPPRYLQWSAFLGLSPAQPAADLSDFGVEGNPRKLRYIGRIEDLRKRLIGESLQEFVARTGLEFIFGGPPADYEGELFELDDNDVEASELAEEPGDVEMDGADGEDQPVEEMLDDAVELVRSTLLLLVRRSCFREGIAPHALLPQAIELWLEVLLEAMPELMKASGGTEDFDVERLATKALEIQGEEVKDELRIALDQVCSAVEACDSLEDLMAELGLGPAASVEES